MDLSTDDGSPGSTSSAEAPPTVPSGLRIGVPQQPSPGPAEQVRWAPSPRAPFDNTPFADDDRLPSLEASPRAAHRAGAAAPADAATSVRVVHVPAERRERPSTGSGRMLAAAGICCLVGALAGAGLALVDARAARQARSVAPLLVEARATAAEIGTTSYPLDTVRLAALLGRLTALDTPVAARTSGPAFTVTRLTTRRGPLGATADQARGLHLLAEAAAPLRRTIAGTTAREAAAPERLDDLARDLNRFAGANTRAERLGLLGPTANSDPGATGPVDGPGIEQLATAAAVLPGLAGTEAARTWIACRSATAGCTRFVVEAGQVRDVVEVPLTAREGDLDVLVTGVEAVELLTGAAVPGPGPSGQGLSVPAALDMLVATRAGEDDSGVVVSSAVPVEQHALDLLTGAR